MAAIDLGPRREYTTVEVGIAQSAEGQAPQEQYSLELRVLDGPQFSRRTLRLDRPALAASSDPERQGRLLGEALFADEALGRVYREALAIAQAARRGLRVRLRLDAPDLDDIHWESIYHPVAEGWQPLGMTADTPFSRYVPLSGWERPEPVSERPIRVLAIVASPQDLDDLSLDSIPEADRQALHAILDRPHDLQVTYLESGTDRRPSMVEIQRALNRGVHAVHILAHGARTPGGTVLFLEDDQELGLTRPVPSDELVSAFALPEKPPIFCFLSACETAERGRHDAFVPLGPALVSEGGIHAVVAMSDRVGLDTARTFSGHFYERLLTHGFVDLAVNEARILIQARWDWSVPVLFSRLPDNRLVTADPVRVALQAMRSWRQEGFLPLPVEVIHLLGQQQVGNLERLDREPAPTLSLQDTLPQVFARRQLADADMRHPAEDGGESKKLVLLVGDRGTARSTQLQHLLRLTAEASVDARPGERVIPVCVNLQDYVGIRSGLANPLETLILAGLQEFWPELNQKALSGLLRGRGGDRLRVLVDGSDDLTDRARQAAWEDLQALVNDYRQHEYLVAVDPDHYEPRLLAATDLLVIRPLSQRSIDRFLRQDLEPSGGYELQRAGLRLYGNLARAHLFDLASSPWLLIRMLGQAREGMLPESRSAVIRDLLESSVAQLPHEQGVAARAAQSLYALAWEMQLERRNTWPVSQAFRTLAAVRGNREYNLETLFALLVENGLLARVGADAMRFAYPAFQAYCAAHALRELPDAARVIDDITASLGRLARLRWWQDSLVLLSGLMPDPNPVLESIIYGTSLAEGEQVSLAVRCILEANAQADHGPTGKPAPVNDSLVEQVTSALVWRLDSANEPRPLRRVRAAQDLGQLRRPSAIPDLVRVVIYDYSRVRMAASLALRAILPQFSADLEAVDPALFRLLQRWFSRGEKDIEDLIQELLHGESYLQSVAAFALGDLQTPKTIEALFDAFLQRVGAAPTRWAVAEAMLLLEPTLVLQRAILPFLDEHLARQAGVLGTTAWKKRAYWYPHMAYLIGRTRAQHPATEAFLRRCLYEWHQVSYKEQAIRALGWMYDRRYKETFERIAAGQFDELALGSGFSPEIDGILLQCTALDALGDIGDQQTVDKIRAAMRADPKRWRNRDLVRAFYRATEEIFWRLELAANR